MTNYEQAQAQLRSAREQAQAQRDLIKEEREAIAKKEIEASQARKELEEQRKKIPVPSQRLLRSGMYAGLEGRKRRQQLDSIKKQIIGKEQEVDTFKGELKGAREQIDIFETKELAPFEAQIQSRASELAEYKKHQDAIKLAEDVFYGTKSAQVFFFGSAPLARKYYNRMMKIKSAQIKTQQDMSMADMSIDPYIRDEKGTPIGSRVPTTKTIPPSLNVNIQSFTRDLSRTDLRKDFSQISKIDTKPSFTMVDNLLDKPFLTTGSPKRITPLLSSKPRLPPTPASPILKRKVEAKMKESNIFGIEKRKEKDKIKFKPKEKSIFLGKKPSKQKKKINLWEW